jgi:UDP-N-acetylmuramoyl-L-alanyl-D-glutamate--2,6-diaminopimelate ligase
MGEIAQRLSDEAIVTDDNPRHEDGDAICAEIVGGMRYPERAVVERQRALAIRRAIALAGRGDAVLVAGKGHETIQDMGVLKVHFSDRAQVVQALQEWEGRGA